MNILREELLLENFETQDEYKEWLKREIRRELEIQKDEFLQNIGKLNRLEFNIREELLQVEIEVQQQARIIQHSKFGKIPYNQSIYQDFVQRRKRLIDIKEAVQQLSVEEHNEWFKSELQNYNAEE
jgi:hypothetical protein